MAYQWYRYRYILNIIILPHIGIPVPLNNVFSESTNGNYEIPSAVNMLEHGIQLARIRSLGTSVPHSFDG
jgi:hypothetical protein